MPADYASLMAPEGPMLPEARLSDHWTWIAVALGAGVITVGGLLFAP